MTDNCDHEMQTAIGSPEFRTVDGVQYRVGKWECDDCGQKTAAVMREIHEFEIDGDETPKQIIDQHRDGWS